MRPLTASATAADRTDLAIELAQHPHVKACDFCRLHLEEIAPDVTQPWARQTLNALAHRCQEAETMATLLEIVTAPPAELPAGDDDEIGGDE